MVVGMPRRVQPPAYLLSVRDDEVHLARRSLRAAGVELWAPQYLEYLSSGPEARMLFPGYAFARIVDQWHVVATTRGVYRVVKFGSEFARVPESVWKELSAQRGESGYIRLRPRFNRWSRVRYANSADGVVGIVQARDSASRVRVLFQLLGRPVEMSVADEDLVAA